MNSPLSPMKMVDIATSVVGELEQWEENMLFDEHFGFGHICYNIAEKHLTSIPRIMKWLKLSLEEGCEEGLMAYSGLLYGLNPDLQYKRDEAAWWVKRVKNKMLLEKACVLTLMALELVASSLVFFSLVLSLRTKTLCYIDLSFVRV